MVRIFLAFLLLISISVKAQPSLKGGLNAFVNANKVYPAYSYQNFIQGTVTVAFKLDTEGKVYGAMVRQGIGTDLDDEALRLIRLSSGKWTVPASHDTSVVLIAPMTFSLSGTGVNERSPAQIQQAIANYKSNEGLTNAVLHFYQKKEGNAKPEELRRIEALKAELGYDEEYLASRIEDGKRKLKQGDEAGACEDFMFVKNMGSSKADELIARYCK